MLSVVTSSMMSFSVTILSIMKLLNNIKVINTQHNDTECQISLMLFSSVIMLSVVTSNMMTFSVKTLA